MNSLDARLVELNEAMIKLSSGKSVNKELLDRANQVLDIPNQLSIDSGPGDDTIIVNEVINNNHYTIEPPEICHESNSHNNDSDHHKKHCNEEHHCDEGQFTKTSKDNCKIVISSSYPIFVNIKTEKPKCIEIEIITDCQSHGHSGD